MTQRQQFNGAVEQVAAGDIKNFVEAPKIEKEYLSTAQRKALNALVAEISAECKVEAQILWRNVVHARVGVDRIGEIQKDKFLDAQDSLVCWRDSFRQLANTQLLIDKVTTLTREKHLHAERDSWCLRKFGETNIKAMSVEQLRQLFCFVDDYVYEQQYLPDREPLLQVTLSPVAQLKMLILEHPAQMAVVLLLGFIIGRVV